MIKARTRTSIFALSSLFAVANPCIADTTTDEKYSAALALARDGQFAPALESLRSLSAEFPDTLRFLYDYIAVLGWAERDVDVVSLASRIDSSIVPRYVLETIAKAARNTHNFGLAISSYGRARERDPQHLENTLGLAMSMADAGQADDALTLLSAQTSTPEQQISLLLTKAYALKAKKDTYFESLAVYDQVLALDPANRDGWRGKILTTQWLGAPHLAARMLEQHPNILSADERASLLADRVAARLGWGTLSALPSDEQRVIIESAVTELRSTVSQEEANGRPTSTVVRRARLDLLVGSHKLGQFEQVIALYTKLTEDHVNLQSYALVVVADAYLQLRQPHAAIPIYRDALKQSPNMLVAQSGLFYALIDDEQHDNALRTIDQFALQTPIWIKREPKGPGRANPERADLDLLAALGRAFSDYLPEAQQRLEPMVATAPYSADVRNGLGTVYAWRGWPRRALTELRIVTAQEPDHLGARVSEMETQLALREYEQAEIALNTAQSIFPSSIQVRQAESNWGMHMSPELRVEISRLASSGLLENVADYTLDTHLFSWPIYYRFRPYLHSYLSAAQFPEGLASYKRFGVGTEFKSRPIDASLELAANAENGSDPGLHLRGRWFANDYWSVGASWQSFATDVPLRARTQGTDGWSLDADTEYRFDEMRRVGAAAHRVAMSDGNIRRAFNVHGSQRLINKPHYKLEATASVQTARNVDVGASYFNPSHDFVTNLTLNNDWILWREYTHSFRHRLAVSAGTYSQQKYNKRLIWGVQYEHQWNWTQRFDLSYGLQRTQRNFDGNAEFATRMYLTLGWRF